jgi:hypothetical protein
LNTDFRNRQLPYNSPFANALVVVVGIIAIAVSFVIGIVAFVALAAAVLVLAAIIGIRIWWLGVKAGKQGGQRPAAKDPLTAQNRARTVIEGEYHIVAGKKDDDSPPQT